MEDYKVVIVRSDLSRLWKDANNGGRKRVLDEVEQALADDIKEGYAPKSISTAVVEKEDDFILTVLLERRL